MHSQTAELCEATNGLVYIHLGTMQIESAFPITVWKENECPRALMDSALKFFHAGRAVQGFAG